MNFMNECNKKGVLNEDALKRASNKNCLLDANISEILILSSKKNLNEDEIKKSAYIKIIANNYSITNIILSQKSYCGRYATIKVCNNRHRVAKIHYCQSEFCPICSKDLSNAHRRRIARLLPYVFSFDALGYFVFTIPKECREKFLDCRDIKNKIQKRIKRILKKNNIDKAIGRWHWFGDKSEQFHPHLNILIDNNYIDKNKLESIKNEYKKNIAKIFGIDVNKISVHYNYTEKSEKIFHKLKYITRATINKKSDKVLLLKLYNYLNKAKNTFVVNSKKFDIEKGIQKASEYKKKIEYSEIEIDEIIELYHIQKKFSSDICPICLENHNRELTEFRQIAKNEVDKELKNGYCELTTMPEEEYQCKIEKIYKKAERQNAQFEKFEKERYERMFFMDCPNYLDNIAITHNSIDNSKKNKYIQERLELF